MSNQYWFDGLEPSAEQLHNVYFAVCPDPGNARRIFERSKHFRDSRRLAGRLIPPDRFHVSLCGVGTYRGFLPARTISEARLIAESITATSIDITFDQVQTFQGSELARPIVLSASCGLPELSTFRRRLGSAMMRGGLVHRLQTGFNPHLTLMYCDRVVEEHPIEPVRWIANEFVLIDSLFGRSQHIILGRWPLRG
jgi:2'-5' RNA ligase